MVTPLFATMLAHPTLVEDQGPNFPAPSVDVEAVHKERGDSLVPAATTASLDAQQDSSNITKTQSKATLNEPTPQGEGSGSFLGRQETMRGAMAQIRPEGGLIQSSNLPLSIGHTVGSREDRMEYELELTNPVPQPPYDSPLSGGHTPGSDEDKENVSKQRRDESNKTEDLNLFDKGSGETKVFDYTTAAKKDFNAAKPVFTAGDTVNAASVIPDVSVAGPSTSTAGDIFEDEMITMADTLMAIRRTRPRTTLVVIHDVEEEPRRAKPRQRMLVDLIAERKRFFAIQRAEQIRNKPPTKAQLRNKMVTYLKHMGKYTHNQSKSKSFEEIQVLYERELKWINDFVPMDSEEVNDSEQQAESSKKRSRVDHDKESVKK
nr:hypothetical protein [Tanacetum cinerariifolium]